MNFPQSQFSIFARWLAVLLVAINFNACASTPELVYHSFQFNAFRDSRDVEILYWQYGNSRQPGVRTPDWAIREGRVGQGASTHGEMLRGEFLHVKWKIKSTGEVYEDKVDLRSRLPRNIKNHTVSFIAKGPQLYVYLVTPERRSLGSPPNGPRETEHYQTITIYPDQSAQAHE